MTHPIPRRRRREAKARARRELLYALGLMAVVIAIVALICAVGVAIIGVRP